MCGRGVAGRTAVSAPAARVVGPQIVVGETYPTNKSLMFEADSELEAVNVYLLSALPKNGAPIASIKVHVSCPYGLAMDKEATLYVADYCDGGDIEEFAKGSTSESRAITDGISNPLGLAIDTKQTLYVSFGKSIVEYAHSHTKPFRTISGQGLYEPFGLAVDKSNNLYIADPSVAAVFEIKHGTTKVSNLGLRGIYGAYGVAVDQKTGYLWVTDGGSNEVDIFKPGTKTPIHQIRGGGFPYAISIQNNGKQDGPVVVSDNHLNIVYAFRARTYVSYAIETNGIELPTGLLVTKP